MAPLIHTFSDSIVILNHVNVAIEYIRRYNTARSLCSRYRRLSQNVPVGSEWLCGNNIKKRVMTFTTTKKMRNNSTSFPTSSSFLNNNSKILCDFLKTLRIILDMVCTHESVQPKKSTKNLQQVPEIHDKLKLVIYLPYNLTKNLMFSLLNKVESIQGGNLISEYIIICLITRLNIPNIHIFQTLFLKLYNQTSKKLYFNGKVTHIHYPKRDISFHWKFKILF